MSTRISLGRVMAAGVIAVLAAIGPVQSVSAEPFQAGGKITSIDDGDVKAAGTSGRFVVRNRHVGGTISGVIGTTPIHLEGEAQPFTFTFKTNVPIQTQSGNIQGHLSFGDFDAKVIAKSEIGVVPCPEGWEPWCMEIQPGTFVLPALLITGSVTFTEGAEGYGTVSAYIVPRLSPEGHILGVLDGGLMIQGQ